MILQNKVYIFKAFLDLICLDKGLQMYPEPSIHMVQSISELTSFPHVALQKFLSAPVKTF